MEIIFKADKKHRDKYFSAGSFAHPAKMMLPLQRWIIEKYSKPGDVILDPMAGQGTLLIACTMGRHIILVELESKFVQMQNDNWTKIQTLGPEMGYEMGVATILQGDARKLPDVLADVVITSPPYEATVSDNKEGPGAGGNEKNYGRWAKGTAKKISYSQDEPCKADVIMTSPPYGIPATSQESSRDEIERRIRKGIKGAVVTEKGECMTGDGKRQQRYSEDPENIGNLPYGNIDCVVTSPPYEGSLIDHSENSEREVAAHLGKNFLTPGRLRAQIRMQGGYANAQADNIGNLKGQSYLSAMLEVYQGCWRVLKPQGLMCLVTKNFIRDKLEVRLDLDTIKLCKQAGFQFVERHYRKLTSQSFWRTIYQQKYPDAPILDKEDILVFRK